MSRVALRQIFFNVNITSCAFASQKPHLRDRYDNFFYVLALDHFFGIGVLGNIFEIVAHHGRKPEAEKFRRLGRDYRGEPEYLDPVPGFLAAIYELTSFHYVVKHDARRGLLDLLVFRT